MRCTAMAFRCRLSGYYIKRPEAHLDVEVDSESVVDESVVADDIDEFDDSDRLVVGSCDDVGAAVESEGLAVAVLEDIKKERLAMRVVRGREARDWNESVGAAQIALTVCKLVENG